MQTSSKFNKFIISSLTADTRGVCATSNLQLKCLPDKKYIEENIDCEMSNASRPKALKPINGCFLLDFPAPFFLFSVKPKLYGRCFEAKILNCKIIQTQSRCWNFGQAFHQCLAHIHTCAHFRTRTNTCSCGRNKGKWQSKA